MSKYLLSAAAAAVLAFGATGAAHAQQRPAAPAPAGAAVAGIGWADIEAAEAGSAAYKAAEAQRPTQYKQYYDQAETRRQQLAAQLKPLYEKIQADSKLPNPNQAALQQQAAAIQQFETAGRAELQRILLPVGYSQAYVSEQIESKLQQAVNTAMAKRGVTLLFKPEALHQVNGAAYNLTSDIIAEINVLIPSAVLSPPPGWEPAQVREQKAREAAAAGQQAAPPPAAAPTGRAQPDGR
jgi:Skp family chaperone for outer membrane proteins